MSNTEPPPSTGRVRGDRPKQPAPPAGGVPSAPVKPKLAAPIDWWKLDPLERIEVLQVLIEWVPELVRRYLLKEAVIPRCWHQHEPLIQELLALFQYRNQQQFLPIAPPSAPLDFHYQFQLAIGRMRSWTQQAGCRGRDHFPTEPVDWANPATGHGAKWPIEALERGIALWAESDNTLTDTNGPEGN